MKKLIIFILLALITTGCGKVTTEEVINTEYIDRTTTENVRIPAPILRSYYLDDIKISFACNDTEIQIQNIYYNYSDDQVSIRVPAGNEGKEIRLYTKGGFAILNHTETEITNDTFVTGFFSESSTVKEMGIVEDVLDVNNEEDYVQLVVDGVVLEQYWLCDF